MSNWTNKAGGGSGVQTYEQSPLTTNIASVERTKIKAKVSATFKGSFGYVLLIIGTLIFFANAFQPLTVGTNYLALIFYAACWIGWSVFCLAIILTGIQITFPTPPKDSDS